MEYSVFVNTKDAQQPLVSNGKKSVTQDVTIDGKKYFKKQLASGYRENLRHRMSLYKEFEIGQRIDCPYIVKYIGINEDEQGLFVLMEHINGMSVNEKMKTEPTYFSNFRNIEKMLNQLLQALKTLHMQNVAYLDLKPENIMLTQISNDVKLIDLGGCFTDSNDYTAERTKEYAAPELAKDQLTMVDARTDIYGVGKILQYIEEQAKVKLPNHLMQIKMRCLNTDKTKRYETVDEVLWALNRRGRMVRNTTYSLLVIVFCIIGWQWFTKTTYYQQLVLFLKSDVKIEGIYYAKSPENNNTCQVIGVSKWEDLYIRDSIVIKGKSYTTTSISDKAFYGCKEIRSVNFPKNLHKIGRKAFFHCSALKSITLPEGVTELGHACFKRAGISNIIIPKSLKVIGHASFAECKQIKELIIPEGIETLELDAFACCHNMISIELPSTLQTISRGVFWECKSLPEIQIPAGVETIGEYAFYHCDSLKHVYNYSPNPQNLSVIFNRTDITLHVPANSVEKYQKAAHWNTLTIVGDL